MAKLHDTHKRKQKKEKHFLLTTQTMLHCNCITEEKNLNDDGDCVVVVVVVVVKEEEKEIDCILSYRYTSLYIPI